MQFLIKTHTMTNQKLRIVSVQTTAFDEENFILFTNLTDEQISDIIEPIVLAEREDAENWYDNDILTQALEDAYPDNYIHALNGLDKLTI
jgi:Mg/Co/Ni transporter MgtE